MEELIELIRTKGDDQICANLLLIFTQHYGKLRKFKLTKANHRLQYLGDIKERELIFWHECLKYKENFPQEKGKYPESMILKFFSWWSENTQDGKKMKWEREKTWELKKRLNTWHYNQINRNY
jgi:hypothetical protein